MAVRVRRVAGAAVLGAAVERQELRRLARRASSSSRPGPGRPRSGRRARRASVTFVGSRSRRYCAIACSTFWPVSGFFSSAVATGMPFTKQREVERLRLVGAVGELADEREPVRVVARDELGREPVRRLEVREPDLDAEVLDAVAQHVDGAALVDLGREPLEEARAARLPRRRAARSSCAPLVRLGRGDEREHLAGIEPERAVERARVALRVAAVLEQPRLDRALELPLRRAWSRRRLRDVELAGYGGSDQRLAVLAQEARSGRSTARARASY